MNEPTVQELFDLSGKVALVTGASGYLGASLAAALAEAGATVVVSSRALARAQAAAVKLPSPGGATHHAVELDYMDDDALQRGFESAVEQAGHVDVLVNNGYDYACARDLTCVTGEQFRRQQGNTAGYFLLARMARDHAVARGASASIIMLGSMYGLVGSYPDAYKGVCAPSPVTYHAFKGGVVQMTRHLGIYWARDGVRVNCLCPGPFPNPAGAPAEMVERLCTKSPMGRIGLPHELKGAAVFLASDASSYMTGQNLVIDGGWTAW